MRRTFLGRRGRLGREGDGARCSGAAQLGGEAPASFYGRHGARGQQVARVASSPPCVSPGQLLDGEATAAEALGFRRRLGRGQRRRLGFGGRPQGGVVRLIKAGRPPWRAGQAREGVHAAGAGGGGLNSSLSPARPWVGDDKRVPLSAAAREGSGGAGWRAAGPARP
jgi:hypothetical protein